MYIFKEINKHLYQFRCLVLIIKAMGNTIFKQKAEIIAGSQQRSFYISFDLLVKNFGYFKAQNCLPNFTDEAGIFHFPTISESIMQNLLDFITKGKQY